jgi:hypothetical protein
MPNNRDPQIIEKKEMSETGTIRIASHTAKPVRLGSERTESGRIVTPIQTDSSK